MLSMRAVSAAEILAAKELLADYALECSIPEIGPVSPQAETYAAMERIGVVRMFGAFEEERLIGFASLILSVLPHYGQKVATVESLFVDREHRPHGAGLELMAAMEECALETGCVAILYSAPSGGKLERLLRFRKSYRRTNAVFVRSL